MNPQANSHGASFDEACQFIIELGVAANNYGSPAGRLQAYLTRLTAAFGFLGSFRITTTDMICAFQEDEHHPQQMHMIMLPGTGLDLSKLALVGDLVDSIESGEVHFSEGSARLEAISKTPEPWGLFASALGYATTGAGLAVLFGCGWSSVIFATIFSVLVYAMVLLSGRMGPATAEWLPLSSTFVVAALTAVTRFFVPDLNLTMVILAAIAVLLPGYSISLGIMQLVGSQASNGTANLMSGLVYLTKQLLGAVLGVSLALALLPQHATTTATPVPSVWLWVFMPPLIIGLCVVFQTSKRDLLWAAIGCAFAYGGILLGSQIAGSNLGNLLGAIFAAIFANLWARETRRPTSIVLLPAIILLVSGSIGFRGLASMATGQVALGEHQFVQMFVVALTIAAGLLVGNTIVRPKVTL